MVVKEAAKNLVCSLVRFGLNLQTSVEYFLLKVEFASMSQICQMDCQNKFALLAYKRWPTIERLIKPLKDPAEHPGGYPWSTKANILRRYITVPQRLRSLFPSWGATKQWCVAAK